MLYIGLSKEYVWNVLYGKVVQFMFYVKLTSTSTASLSELLNLMESFA